MQWGQRRRQIDRLGRWVDIYIYRQINEQIYRQIGIDSQIERQIDREREKDKKDREYLRNFEDKNLTMEESPKSTFKLHDDIIAKKN